MLNIPTEVKDALREGALRKNYKMKVNDVDPDTGERTYLYTIDNDTLVSESVKIDERMVTGKVLKFGLCEGSCLEFQYFDYPNINGKDVQVYCSVEYVDGNGDIAWYDIPMGWYTVDQCPMQWDTGIYKVTAYNKLKSDYLDAKANDAITEILKDGEGDSTSVSLYKLLEQLLEGYQINTFTESSISTILTYTYSVSFNGEYSIQECNAQGVNTGYYYHLVIAGFQFVPTASERVYGDYYRYVVNAKLIREFFMDKFAEYYNDNIYVKVSGNVVTFKDAVLNYESRYADFLGKAFIRALQQTEAFCQTDLVDTGYIVGTDPMGSEGWSDLNITLPLYIVRDTSTSTPSPSPSQACSQILDGIITAILERGSFGQIFHADLGMMEKLRLSYSDMENFTSDITIRELQSAVYETNCQYGKLDRETDLFTGVELNQGGLLPADNLYPANDLYPQGDMEHPFPSSYQKLWTDTVGEQSFRYLIITYKGTETVDGQTQEVEKKLQRTVNTNGTTDYNMSDNWLFRNLVWTDEDVGDYADAMVEKMRDIRWFPFEMWAVGMPYIETGDAIEITDKQGNTHTSYVLTRTLNGIQNLQDTFVNGELDIF